MRCMVNKLRKTPSGSPLPSGRASPIGRAEAQPRVKPTRTRSLTDTLGGLRLRAAATQVNESLSSLRRSGSAHLKSVLRRRHSAPPDAGHDAHADATDADINPDALHPQPGQPWVKHFVIDGERYMQHGNGIPQRVPQVPFARPPLDAAG